MVVSALVMQDEVLQLVDEEEEQLHSFQEDLNELMCLIVVYDELIHEHIQVPMEREENFNDRMKIRNKITRCVFDTSVGIRVSDNVRRGASANFFLLRFSTCCAYSFVLDNLSL
jgi:hypothetical protein